MMFKNRIEAADLLSTKLEKYKNDKGVVLAVPRGGVPIGYHIARKLNLPLELIMIKKIGHPLSGEYAIGAVGLQGVIIEANENIPPEYIESEIQRIRDSLKSNYKKYTGNGSHISLKNKILIVVDDGLATGNTIAAAIKILRMEKPSKIIVAVPVAPPETAKKIKNLSDDFICLLEPLNLYGVGQFYEDFEQVSDEEVIMLMKDSRLKTVA